MACKSSDEQDCIPECLFTLKQVKDPYSTDEEQETDTEDYAKSRREKRKNKRKSTISDSISMKQEKDVIHTHRTTSVARVVETFNIRFLPLPKTTKKYHETLSMEIKEILDLFLPLIFQNVSGQQVIDSVLNHSDPPSTMLQILYDLKSYDIPEGYDGKAFEPEIPGRSLAECRHLLSELMSQMQKVEAKVFSSLHDDDAETNSYQHDQLKDFFCQFLTSCLFEGCRLSGSCRYTFSLAKTPSEKYETRHKSESNDNVVAQPDLLIGYSVTRRQIPVEIYSPHKLEEHPAFCPPESESNLSSSDQCEEDFVSLKNFLNKNMPNFMGAKRSCQGIMFKHKMTKRLLLQLLGSSKSFIDVGVRERNMFKKEKRVFIGLLVCQFYVYILKMEAYEFDIDMIGEPAAYAKDSLNVQFLPLPLDIRLSNHGIALLFLLKYYRRVYM